MFGKLFGGRAPIAETFEGPYYRVALEDGQDFDFPNLYFDRDSLISVKLRRNDLSSYLVAAKHAGEAMDINGWQRGSRLVIVKGNPLKQHDDPRFFLFDRLLVEGYLPEYCAFGDNGESVEKFLGELFRRGNVNAKNRIPYSAWQLCDDFLKVEQHDPNRAENVRAAWNAAYAFAETTHAVAACNSCSSLAKDTAMRASHHSKFADARDAAEPGNSERTQREEDLR